MVREAEKDVLAQKAVRLSNQNAAEEQCSRSVNSRPKIVEKQLSDLEKRYPGLLATASALPTQSAEFNLSADRANLSGIEARMEALKNRVQDLEAEARKLADIAPQVAQLERKRDIEDTNYKYFQASLEKARVDEALDPSKMPNISAVQKPSPPMRVTGGLKKKVLGLVGGGLAVGIVLAFLIELVVDRSVKRPFELTTSLRIPMLLWIPYLRGRNRLALAWPRGSSTLQLSGNGHMAPWDLNHFIRPFSEALRDRLTLYFQVNNMVHKPKLVAVTGCSKGAGTSTLAAGPGRGAIRNWRRQSPLVDMNDWPPRDTPLFPRTPSRPLSEALVGEPAPAGEISILPWRHLQARTTDRSFRESSMTWSRTLKRAILIILSSTCLRSIRRSITLVTAEYMDKLSWLRRRKKATVRLSRRAYLELAAVNANVSAILNKLRVHTTKWLAVEG